MTNGIPDPIELTQELIRFNTINPPGNEDQVCNYLAKLLESVGYECRKIEFAPHRMSLVAKIGACTEEKPSICFTGHVDVVHARVFEEGACPRAQKPRDQQV